MCLGKKKQKKTRERCQKHRMNSYQASWWVGTKNKLHFLYNFDTSCSNIIKFVKEILQTFTFVYSQSYYTPSMYKEC